MKTDYEMFREMLNKFMSVEKCAELEMECYGNITKDFDDGGNIVHVIELIGADCQKMTFIFTNEEFSEWY